MDDKPIVVNRRCLTPLNAEQVLGRAVHAQPLRPAAVADVFS